MVRIMNCQCEKRIPANRRALAAALGWICVLMPASAPAAKAPAPAAFILDESRALPEQSQAALSSALLRFREATGCGVFVVTTTFLSGESVRDHATALADSWMSEGRGVVLAYDRATDAHAITPTQSMWKTYPTPALVEAFREAGGVMQDKTQPLERRLIESTGVLMTRITRAEEERRLHGQLLPGHDLWAALVFLLLLVAGALGCGLMLAHLRKRDASNAIRYFFPQADAAMRFGAPYGGGVIVEAGINRPHP